MWGQRLQPKNAVISSLSRVRERVRERVHSIKKPLLNFTKQTGEK
jgi:hypothetical protein